jgi:hypothetical protein
MQNEEKNDAASTVCETSPVDQTMLMNFKKPILQDEFVIGTPKVTQVPIVENPKIEQETPEPIVENPKTSQETPEPIVENPKTSQETQKENHTEQKKRTDNCVVVQKKFASLLYEFIVATKGFMFVLWSSTFMLLIFLLMFSAILFGIDFSSNNTKYIALHGVFVVCVIRCLQLNASEEREDKVKVWVTKRKG